MPYKDPQAKKAWYQKNKERSRLKQAAYYKANKEKLTKLVKTWIADNKQHVSETARVRRLYNLYGLTQERYDQILADQNGVCALCKKPPDNKGLVVDHEHILNYEELLPEEKAKYVRGLLHRNCNVLLGYANDDSELLTAAITYLEHNSRRDVPRPNPNIN